MYSQSCNQICDLIEADRNFVLGRTDTTEHQKIISLLKDKTDLQLGPHTSCWVNWFINDSSNDSHEIKVIEYLNKLLYIEKKAMKKMETGWHE